MLAKVPRTMTWWFPRREPYELKSTFSTPLEIRYWPAGLAAGMLPAGEMWSVVTELPTITRTRPPTTSRSGSGSAAMPSKYGGSWT